MNREGFFNKPFQVFLGFFYLTLCLGTLILEINDNIFNAYFFFVFFLLALYGQNRTLNYKYLTGGGEKIWDKHARKGLFFAGKNFEVVANSDFYNERYKSVKNLGLDNLRRFFSYLMIACYFLVLFLSGQLSHSFLNIVPFLICLTILKVTYLGHYLIPLLINILGVSYAYVQYDITLDFFTILYIFFIFVLLVLYRKVEQQQILYDSDYFKKSLPWDRGEKRNIAKLGAQYTIFFVVLLLIVMHFTPHQWGNSETRVSEYTQIKAERLGKWVLRHISRPDWLKKDQSDTGAPVKEFGKGAGEKISEGTEDSKEGKAKSLKFEDDQGRLFNMADQSGKENKGGLKFKENPEAKNESGAPVQPSILDKDGEKRKQSDQSENQTGGSAPPQEGDKPAKPNDNPQGPQSQQDKALGAGGTAQPQNDPQSQVSPKPEQGQGLGGQGSQDQKTDGNTSQGGGGSKSGDQKSKPEPSKKKNESDKGAPQDGKGDNAAKSGGSAAGSSGANGKGSGGSGSSEEKKEDQKSETPKSKQDEQTSPKDSDKNDKKNDEENKDDKKDQNDDQNKDQNKDDKQPNEDDKKDDKNPGDEANQQEKDNEQDNPMLPWWLLLLILLALALIGYLIYRWRKNIRQVEFASPLREDLRQGLDDIQKMNLSPEQEVIVRYNFFQKVSNHLLPHESIKLPPSLYASLVTNQFTKIKKPVDFVTRVFSDVHYGEYPVSPEILKQYREQMKVIFEFFRF